MTSRPKRSSSLLSDLAGEGVFKYKRHARSRESTVRPPRLAGDGIINRGLNPSSDGLIDQARFLSFCVYFKFNCSLFGGAHASQIHWSESCRTYWHWQALRHRRPCMPRRFARSFGMHSANTSGGVLDGLVPARKPGFLPGSPPLAHVRVVPGRRPHLLVSGELVAEIRSLPGGGSRQKICAQQGRDLTKPELVSQVIPLGKPRLAERLARAGVDCQAALLECQLHPRDDAGEEACDGHQRGFRDPAARIHVG